MKKAKKSIGEFAPVKIKLEQLIKIKGGTGGDDGIPPDGLK